MKILEATCCIRKAEIEIINTEMDIFVEWDVAIDKREYQAQLQIIPKEVKGSFTYKHNYVDYKVAHKVTFAAMPDKWKIQCLHSNIAKFGIATYQMMQPETIHIDFDNLKINITF